ncbi:MAG: DUF1848 domain-containing protein [Candidatus Methanoperedens sp.]|nr:DUF1848 domain-containing protein [Candidatus Methanoperedens sp.]
MKIISVSRRTDIPAFYGDWFMNRLKEGFAGYVNPFGGQKYILPLKPEDVTCFVFWSKNYTPFFDNLKIIEKMGYKFYFNYTITGLPNIFECNLVKKEISIDSLKKLSDLYTPKHINWRYDPIIVSEATDYNFHVKNFEKIASALEGYVERCYFSYAIQYGKVKRNFDKFQSENNIKIVEPDANLRIKLANELADIAGNHGIKLLTCCGDYLLNQKIAKAHCVDGKIIEELFYKNGFKLGEKPTRKDCGCTDSADIGAYDTCPHGCIYCYANMNKKIAENRHQNHDKNAAFLGFTKVESDKWVEDVKRTEIEKRTADVNERKIKEQGSKVTLFDFV